MKKKSLFLLLFISTSLCAMDKGRQEKISLDQYSIRLHNLIKEAQSNWEKFCCCITPFSLSTRNVEFLPVIRFEVLKTVLEKKRRKLQKNN